MNIAYMWIKFKSGIKKDSLLIINDSIINYYFQVFWTIFNYWSLKSVFNL
jgi:hypothetical protein